MVFHYKIAIAGISSAALLIGTFASAATVPQGTTLYTGTASGVTVSSLTLTVPRGPAYTVQVGNSTTIWNKAGATLPLASIANGDSVRIDGTLVGTSTVTAAVIRDTSK